jgi:hypothetical protein
MASRGSIQDTGQPEVARLLKRRTTCANKGRSGQAADSFGDNPAASLRREYTSSRSLSRARTAISSSDGVWAMRSLA